MAAGFVHYFLITASGLLGGKPVSCHPPGVGGAFGGPLWLSKIAHYCGSDSAGDHVCGRARSLSTTAWLLPDGGAAFTGDWVLSALSAFRVDGVHPGALSVPPDAHVFTVIFGGSV